MEASVLVLVRGLFCLVAQCDAITLEKEEVSCWHAIFFPTMMHITLKKRSMTNEVNEY